MLLTSWPVPPCPSHPVPLHPLFLPHCRGPGQIQLPQLPLAASVMLRISRPAPEPLNNESPTKAVHSAASNSAGFEIRMLGAKPLHHLLRKLTTIHMPWQKTAHASIFPLMEILVVDSTSWESLHAHIPGLCSGSSASPNAATAPGLLPGLFPWPVWCLAWQPEQAEQNLHLKLFLFCL